MIRIHETYTPIVWTYVQCSVRSFSFFLVLLLSHKIQSVWPWWNPLFCDPYRLFGSLACCPKYRFLGLHTHLPWLQNSKGLDTHHFRCRRHEVILAKRQNDNDDGEARLNVSLAVVAVAVVSFWPLLALFRDTNDALYGFDIDMFMALKGILDSGSTNLDAYYDDIVELPQLSPAEQLVGAIFGPPWPLIRWIIDWQKFLVPSFFPHVNTVG